MEYTEFINAVCDHINETCDGVRVSVHEAVKNNGVKLSGLSFHKEGYNASPTVYMEGYYSEYLSGADICDIADRLVTMYHENDMAVKLDMSFFESFESVKDRLFIKLINKSRNAEFLKDAPYEEYLDLAIVCYVRIYERKIGSGIIMVRNEHVKLWGVDPETVLETAMKNTHDHDGFNLQHIIDVLSGLGHGRFDDNDIDRESFPMYVATNKKMTNGASVLAMKDKLREFGETIGSDYYIIPSSVNELILLAKGKGDNVCDIDTMIKQVNESELAPDDVLADHAYLYRLKDEVLIF